MPLEARSVELRELAVERRREELADLVTAMERNLPHVVAHVSSDGLA
jgi:hypothetical protein